MGRRSVKERETVVVKTEGDKEGVMTGRNELLNELIRS